MSNLGILDDSTIRSLFTDACIISSTPDSDQIQPASLDLRLGTRAWRVRASFLPGANSTVLDKLSSYGLQELDLSSPQHLETNCVYIFELQESLSLPSDLSASANPKSSTGRLDIFTRVICDHSTRFDNIPQGYDGPLYLEVSPRTFPILVRSGSRLAQIRFRKGDCKLSNEDLHELHNTSTLVEGSEISIYDNSVALSINLSGEKELIGYRANRHTGVVDVDNIGAYCVHEFWEPVYNHGSNNIVLDPDEFYILASQESVHIPSTVAAEMVAFDSDVGEFRVHYAGFFDPGFGSNGATKAVLEVRARDVPYIVEHGQIVARLVYERMLKVPENLYGSDLASNYQGQGLKLSKHFSTDTDQQHPLVRLQGS